MKKITGKKNNFAYYHGKLVSQANFKILLKKDKKTRDKLLKNSWRRRK